LSGQFKSISEERILGEFKKAWTKGKRNSEHFIKLLAELGVGETLFGPDFQPKAVKLEGDPETLANGNFVAFFLQGGDAAALKPSNEMMQYLNMAKIAVQNEQQPYEYIKDRSKLPLLIKVLSGFSSDAADSLKRATDLPLAPKELAIGGRELVGMGLKGPDIGKAQKAILGAIYSGEIQNEPEEIEEFLRSKM